MGTVSYAIPTVGQPNSTEDPKIATALTQIAAVLNGNIDPTNLAASLNALLFNPGDLKVTASAATPAGFLPCNGSAMSRTTYAALFAAIGTTWGPGDGSTTFNLPDYQGRTIVGAGSGASLTARSVGQVFGEENHILGATEMPSHSHAVSDPGHAHQVLSDLGSGGSGDGRTVHQGNADIGPNALTAASGSGVTINNTGGGGGHNNIQPSAVANVFVKT